MTTKPYPTHPLDTVDPYAPRHKPSRVAVTVPGELIAQFHKYQRQKYENFRCVEAVLRVPNHFYMNTRQLNTAWLCACGRPELRYDLPGGSVEFPADCVYVVYLTDKYIVHDWGFEWADEHDGTHVKLWDKRFGSLLWTRQSTP